MRTTLKETRAAQVVVAALVVAALGLAFAMPSGAVDNCYPSCQPPSEPPPTSTSEVEATSSTAVDTTTTEVESTTTVAEETTSTVTASGEHEGGGSLPVTGGDIVGMALIGMVAVAIGSSLLLVTRKARTV